MTNSTKLIERFETFIDLIEHNQTVKNWLGEKFNYLKMKNFLWLAVDLAANKHKEEAIIYLKKAIRSNWKCIYQKSFFAVIKHLLIS
jgi:hypothetical protein